jgi:predicted transposase/invertase (TIGR01784 family)
MSPLANPVVSAIFLNVQSAGMAARSIIDAILKSDSSGLNGKIIRITPQSTYDNPRFRGCRVDVEVETDANELIVFEIQIFTDTYINVRNLFSSSHTFVTTSNKGDSPAEMAKNMPRTIHINLLNFMIRDNNDELVQPFKVLYTKPPTEVAVENFSGYDIQLPAVEKMKQDFADPLYCWCYTLYTAQKEEKTIEEVIAMNPELQAFARMDSGYSQFCEQYNLAAADPQTMKDYRNWVLDAMREQGMIEGGRREGREEGKKEERMIWEAVVAKKDAKLADKDVALADKDAEIEKKDTILADKDALIKELQNQLKAVQGITQ